MPWVTLLRMPSGVPDAIGNSTAFSLRVRERRGMQAACVGAIAARSPGSRRPTNVTAAWWPVEPRESTPPPGFGDLVSKLDDAVHRRSLEATPADELRRVADDEETRVPGRSARVRGDGISGGLERGSERCPAGHDIVAERRSQRVRRS